MYGLPKVHKNGYPIRPIMSAIGTFNYKLSKFLVPILSPITLNQYTVKDTFNFVKEICNKNYEHCTLASFDIKSLFTNIPLKETIDICINNIFRNTEKVHNFNKSQLHKFLTLAATECYFIFNEDVYKQTDGVAMGNPLGPTLANAFLSHYEVKWLNECPHEFKPLFYRRYVDDTFLIFRAPHHAQLFLEYLNTKHTNIQFTAEMENEGKLSFLDVNIKKENTGFTTSVYRKPTTTGLTTKFTSFIPIEFKRNLVSTLAIRAYNICSNYFHLHEELNFIKEMLFKNGFNKGFADIYIGKCLQSLLHPKIPKTTVNKAVLYFPITFMGKSSFTLKNKISKLMKEFYPQTTVRVILKPYNTIQGFFRFKDQVPIKLQSSVIYKYNCHCCNAMYYGQTKRHLYVRINEHLGRSIRTGLRIGNPSSSAIRDHSREHNHPINFKSFSILTSASEIDLNIIESLYIYRDKPSLNNNTQSVNLLCF